jgi:peroxiredoxin
VSPEAPEALAKYAAAAGLEFPLLSDPELAVARAFGLVNPANEKLPHPTTLVIDGSGAVRWIRIDEEYRQRPTALQVLDEVDRLPAH